MPLSRTLNPNLDGENQQPLKQVRDNYVTFNLPQGAPEGPAGASTDY